jgi:hypothetical protein
VHVEARVIHGYKIDNGGGQAKQDAKKITNWTALAFRLTSKKTKRLVVSNVSIRQALKC